MVKTFFLQITVLVLISIVGFLFYAHPDWLNNIPYLSDGGSAPTLSSPVPSPQKLIIVDPLTFPQTQVPKATISKLEIANTPEKRALGLGGRDFLATDSGMLFIFDKPGKPQFWMKGMRIPLDFIFISNDQVSDILTNIAPPQKGQLDADLPRYSSKQDFDKLLEVNSGFVSASGIVKGDKLLLTY